MILLENLLKRESNKIQSYYILGFLKYRKDDNRPEALQYFEKFLKKAEGKKEYKQLVGAAKNYKAKIEAQMGL